MLTDADALAPLGSPPIRPSLSAAGAYGGAIYACPVAMGGYAWLYNAALLSEIPADFRALPELKPAGKNKEPAHYVNCAADGPYLSWSGALCALMADRTEAVGGAPQATPRAGEGIDLGLPYAPTAPPEAPAQTRTVRCYLPTRLPENFRTDQGAYGDFVAGRAAAIPGTQREIRRLEMLSDAGRAPDYRVAAAGTGFTDQLLLYAVADCPRADGAQRQALCAQLLDLLLTDESQRALESVRAFPVIDTPPLYSAQSGMAQLEAALLSRTDAVNAFDADFRARMRTAADALPTRP
jgi:hypothetical protein